jgi:hypothetical protein
VRVIPLDIETLIARHEIHDVLARYNHGVDRQDWEMLRGCYHADAIHEHTGFRGSPDEFVALLQRSYKEFSGSYHFVGNELIDVDGDHATSEQYSVTWHRELPTGDGPAVDIVLGMRYADRLERRDGVWRIAERQCHFDWSRRDPVGQEERRAT